MPIGKPSLPFKKGRLIAGTPIIVQYPLKIALPVFIRSRGAPRDLMNTGNAIFNGYWTMMGVPAISLPFLKGKDGLPIGIQFIANWSEDLKLLEICKYILEKEKLAD